MEVIVVWHYGETILSLIIFIMIFYLLHLFGLNVFGSITTFSFAIILVSLITWARK